VDETERIIDLALDIIAHREKYSEACKGRKLATLLRKAIRRALSSGRIYPSSAATSASTSRFDSE